LEPDGDLGDDDASLPIPDPDAPISAPGGLDGDEPAVRSEPESVYREPAVFPYRGADLVTGAVDESNCPVSVCPHGEVPTVRAQIDGGDRDGSVGRDKEQLPPGGDVTHARPTFPRPVAGEVRDGERRTIGARADPRGTAIPVPRGPVDRPNRAWLRWGIDAPEGDRARPGSATASARQHAPLRQEEGRTPAVGGEVRPLGSAASPHLPDLGPGAGDIVPDHHPRSIRRERHPGDVRHLGGGERDSLLRAGLLDAPDLRGPVVSTGDQHAA